MVESSAGMWRRRSVAQHVGGDDDALNFAGAFVDFGDARVAVVPLDAVLDGVAVAAEDLDRLVGDTRWRLSEANSLAMAASCCGAGPDLCSHAARKVSSRAASSSVAMSASMN